MTVVDFIDLDDDECCVKVDYVDLSSDEDSVEDGHVEEGDNVAQAKKAAEAAASLSISECDATATTSVSKVKQEQGATTTLSMVDHGAPTSSLIAEEAELPQYQGILVASDGAEEATQFGKHDLIVVADCVGEAMQNIVEASNFELHPEVSLDIAIVPPSAHDKEKQVNTSAAECDKQLSIVHTKGVQPIVLHESGFRMMGNAGNGEVVMCKYQGCSKPSQGNTTHCEVHSAGSEGCMVQGCTEGAHGDTSLCIYHHSRLQSFSKRNSRLQKVFCAVNGCTSTRRRSSEGRTDVCVKHGGGKRCKYDGCGKSALWKTDFCAAHGGGKRCKCEGCGKIALWKTDFCAAHGGGRRCKYEGCGKITPWKTNLCAAHGGGRQCKFEGCRKGARGKTGFCIAHGGGRRCKFEGCMKATQGKNDYCTKHGGERRYKMCKHEHGCGNYAQGTAGFCIAHGGGRRCKFEGCGDSAPRRSDYCLEHGDGCCRFQGCSAGATCRTDFCSMHRKILLSGNYTAHEMQPRPLPPMFWAKKARRNSCSVIGGRAQKRQNTNCYVDNTRSFNAFEMGEERGRVSVCQDNMLKTQQTTRETEMDSDPNGFTTA